MKISSPLIQRLSPKKFATGKENASLGAFKLMSPKKKIPLKRVKNSPVKSPQLAKRAEKLSGSGSWAMDDIMQTYAVAMPTKSQSSLDQTSREPDLIIEEEPNTFSSGRSPYFTECHSATAAVKNPFKIPRPASLSQQESVSILPSVELESSVCRLHPSNSTTALDEIEDDQNSPDSANRTERPSCRLSGLYRKSPKKSIFAQFACPR